MPKFVVIHSIGQVVFSAIGPEDAVAQAKANITTPTVAGNISAVTVFKGESKGYGSAQQLPFALGAGLAQPTVSDALEIGEIRNPTA